MIRSVMTYACPAWEFAAGTYLLKLQCLQKVLRTTGNLPMCTMVRDMHVAFQISYVYDYITKLRRRQAEIIHNHENEMYAILDKAYPPPPQKGQDTHRQEVISGRKSRKGSEHQDVTYNFPEKELVYLLI
jgi:hypothetical protein